MKVFVVQCLVFTLLAIPFHCLDDPQPRGAEKRQGRSVGA
jgi:hypothetical protein